MISNIVTMTVQGHRDIKVYVHRNVNRIGIGKYILIFLIFQEFCFMQMDIVRIFSEVYYLLILYIILHNKFYGFHVLLFAYDLYVFITISLVSYSIK